MFASSAHFTDSNPGCGRQQRLWWIWRLAVGFTFESHRCTERVDFRPDSTVRFSAVAVDIRWHLLARRFMNWAGLLISWDPAISSLLWEKFGKVGAVHGVAGAWVTPFTSKPNN